MTIAGAIAARIKDKCTGKLESFITAGGGCWRCSCLSPMCPCVPICKQIFLIVHVKQSQYIQRNVLPGNSLSIVVCKRVINLSDDGADDLTAGDTMLQQGLQAEPLGLQAHLCSRHADGITPESVITRHSMV